MIGAYKGKSPTSLTIKLRTWESYTHVSEIREEDGRVIEAWPPRVVERPDYHAGHTPGTVIDLFDVPDLNQAQRMSIWISLKREVGKLYDFPGLIGFGTRTAFMQRFDWWFCSELIFQKYRDNGVHLLKRIPAHKVYPGLVVYSPILVYVGRLIVGQDADLIGMPIREIVRIRAARVTMDFRTDSGAASRPSTDLRARTQAAAGPSAFHTP